MKIVRCVLVLIAVLSGGALRAEAPHPLMPDYCNILVTYACHAKTLWHEEPDGGYWGDGLDAKNQNGAVRGTCNTLFTYAILIKAIDNEWIHPADLKILKKADLDRKTMLGYVQKNLAYLSAHHVSCGQPASPRWGHHWQSSLWLQSMGMGAMLCWEELGDDLKKGVARVAASEADWVVSHPPKDAMPGDTGAEENAWNTGALAVSVALNSNATSSTRWWDGLKSFAVNTYSHPDDKAATGPVTSLVSTNNVNRDWSLVNHHFFHPDYVQVSGMHLGEAWVILKLGDALNGTNLAHEFEPYAKHNVLECWQRVLRPMLLNSGEFAYPSGNDWTFHCSTNQGYFAYIATAFDDFDASEAEARALEHVKNRRDASPPGHLLGDSNLEWWWEPLVCKRSATAMLLHAMRPGVVRVSGKTRSVDELTTTVHLPEVAVWAHRTQDYFFSVSYRKPLMGFYHPLGRSEATALYSTLPVKSSVLPEGPWEFKPGEISAQTPVAGGTFWREGKLIGALMCMDSSVVLFSRVGFQPTRVENDSLTEPGRRVNSSAGIREVATFEKTPEIRFPGKWICVDETFAMVSGGGFKWEPAKKWGLKSVAFDSVRPVGDSGVLQLLSTGSADTKIVAETLVAEKTTTGIEALVQDGVYGGRYRVLLDDAEFSFQPAR